MKLSFVIVALLAISAYAQEAEVAAPKTTAGSATQEALSALQGGLKEHNEFYTKALSDIPRVFLSYRFAPSPLYLPHSLFKHTTLLYYKTFP